MCISETSKEENVGYKPIRGKSEKPSQKLVKVLSEGWDAENGGITELMKGIYKSFCRLETERQPLGN